MIDVHERAELARQVLSNPVFVDVFDQTRERIVQGIEGLPLDVGIERDRLMLSLKILRELRDEFQDYLNAAALAAKPNEV